MCVSISSTIRDLIVMLIYICYTHLIQYLALRTEHAHSPRLETLCDDQLLREVVQLQDVRVRVGKLYTYIYIQIASLFHCHLSSSWYSSVHSQ